MNERHVEAVFPLWGGPVKADHGWPLYAGLSKLAPWLHECKGLTISPIEGAVAKGKRLHFGPDTQVRIRAREADVHRLVQIARQPISVKRRVVVVGPPSVDYLKPWPIMHARIVVIARGKRSGGLPVSWEDYEPSLRQKLDDLGGQSATLVPGRRRVLRVKGYKSVGYAIGIEGLTPDASIALQATGLGGRRRMGAGFCVPGPLPEELAWRHDRDAIEEREAC